MRAATSSITRRSLAGAAAFSATTAGLVGIAPAAGASATSISIHTAGTKQVGAVTSAWGTVNGDGAGVLACTQVLVNGSWSQSQCAKTTSGGAYAIELTYGKTTTGTTSWRVVADGKISPTATLTRTSGSTTSGSVDYIKHRTPSGISLYPSTSYGQGYNGVKVYLVQKALGQNPGPMDSSLGPVEYSSSTMWKTTKTKIVAFQKAHRGLRTDGVVDAATFYAIKDAAPAGSEIKNPAYNFDVDALVEKRDSSLTDSSTYEQKVNAMIAWAKKKQNVRYIWGGTGPMGYDCSGLLLQALRAGGFKPSLTNDTDVKPPSRLAQAMFAERTALAPLAPNSTMKAGDFIFFGNKRTERVGHVAMYLDSTHMLHAIGSKVQVTSLDYDTQWPDRMGVARVH